MAEKVALVTGSSKGIGFGIARKLKSEGVRVILNGRSLSDLELSANKLKAEYIKADVESFEDVGRLKSELLERFGRLDYLVCNVGSGRSVPAGEETYEEWIRMIHLNLLSTTNVVECLKEQLIDSKGSMVCVSSICGKEVVPGAPVTYSVAKAALNAYVKGISRFYGKQGVRVNAVCPGNILFEGSVWDKKIKENPENVNKMLSSDVPMNKLGNVDDVANAVSFLLSDSSNFINGEIIISDGGQTRSL